MIIMEFVIVENHSLLSHILVISLWNIHSRKQNKMLYTFTAYPWPLSDKYVEHHGNIIYYDFTRDQYWTHGKEIDYKRFRCCDRPDQDEDYFFDEGHAEITCWNCGFFILMNQVDES